MKIYRVTWTYNGSSMSRDYYTDYHAEQMRNALVKYVDSVHVSCIIWEF